MMPTSQLKWGLRCDTQTAPSGVPSSWCRDLAQSGLWSLNSAPGEPGPTHSPLVGAPTRDLEPVALQPQLHPGISWATRQRTDAWAHSWRESDVMNLGSAWASTFLNVPSGSKVRPRWRSAALAQGFDLNPPPLIPKERDTLRHPALRQPLGPSDFSFRLRSTSIY